MIGLGLLEWLITSSMFVGSVCRDLPRVDLITCYHREAKKFTKELEEEGFKVIKRRKNEKER